MSYLGAQIYADSVQQPRRPTPFHVGKTRSCQRRFELLMMGGVSPETCSASYKHGIIIFIAVPCCMLFQSLLHCSNSCTSLHFKTLKSHTKTLQIRPYMFRSPLKPSSGSPWPYFSTLLNWNVDLHLLQRVSVCGCMSVHSVIQNPPIIIQF